MKPARQYLESKILNASKEDLLIMLLDGALRFGEQGRSLMAGKEIEAGGRALVRTQQIVLELITCLNRDELGADVHDTLMGLYGFIHGRLVKANVQSDVALVDEALRVLAHVRETWVMSLDKDRLEKLGPMLAVAPVAASPVERPSPSLNLEG